MTQQCEPSGYRHWQYQFAACVPHTMVKTRAMMEDARTILTVRLEVVM